MLVFVPGYDSATRSNLSIANDFELDANDIFLNQNADRNELFKFINQMDSIFIMSHGGKNAIFYDGDKEAINCQDATSFANKNFFVFACHTATNLGKIMADNRNVWWGYTGAISAPDSEQEVREIVKPIFKYVLDNFHLVTYDSNPSISEVLVEIKVLCDTANEQLDSLNTNDDLNYFDTKLCLEHFWNRLRIWYKDGILEPMKHPHAPSPFLFD